MRKLFLLFAALCCTVMAQAEVVYNVPYIDANGVEQICDSATVVDYSGPFTWTEGWYVVTNFITYRSTTPHSFVCKGDVHLILHDGGGLQTYGEKDHAGIEVSGDGNSITIYGQKKHEGQLIAHGGQFGAGIGGGNGGNGTNITINGGRVEAYGGESACAIGGGLAGYGSNITINGGTVIAISGSSVPTAVGSVDGSSSNIFVADRVKAMISNTRNLNSVANRILIEHSSIEDDIASDITRFVTFASIEFTPFFAILERAAGDVQDDILLQFIKNEEQKMVDDPKVLTYDEAIAACNLPKAKIKAAKELVQYIPDDEKIRKEEYIDYIFNLIGSLKEESQVESQKYMGIGKLQGFTTGYNIGKEKGKADAFGTMGTKQNGPAVEVIDQDGKEVILYSPKSVEYIKVKE